MTDHKRRDPRAPIEVEITLESESNFYAGITGNVSTGGIFVATYTPPKLGAMVALTLKLEDGAEPYDLIGRVCWARSVERASKDAPAGCGIRWVDLSEDALAAITAFVDKRDSIFHDDE